MIRRYYIHVRLDCDPNFSAKKAQEAFTGVDELTLDVFQAQFGSSDYKVLKLFEGIRDVRKARVYGSITGFPEYADWLEGAMMTPDGTIVPGFGEGETNIVRPYDIWTVSETWHTLRRRAYKFAAWRPIGFSFETPFDKSSPHVPILRL